jgi:hypothetical protein
MTLNPYQNDLLSFYLEKSAATVSHLIGTGPGFKLTGNPKIGRRPGLPAPRPNIAPNRAPNRAPSNGLI